MITVLFAGDIVGSRGCDFAAKAVYKIRGREKLDIVVVNGENSADGNGITRSSAEKLLSFADVVTTGNHCFKRHEAVQLFDKEERILRPANYPEGAAGRGVCVLDKGSYSFAVVNLMGTAFMEAIDNPFFKAEEIIGTLRSKGGSCSRGELRSPIVLVDFHGEATSEKKAMGYLLKGRVSAVIGTHTHVQTADETILDGATAYITDAGMCGAEDSVLGVKSELALKRQMYKTPVRFVESDNPQLFCGVIIGINERTGAAERIERVQLREESSAHFK